MATPPENHDGFLTVAQTDSELTITMHMKRFSRNTGCYGVVLSVIFSLIYFVALFSLPKDEGAFRLIFYLVSIGVMGIFLAYVFVLSLGRIYGIICVRIDRETIRIEKNAWFLWNRFQKFPRTDILRLEKNVAQPSPQDMPRPTVEIVLPRERCVLVCRDGEEQNRIESLLRNFLGESLNRKFTDDFRTKTDETDEKLVVVQPPQQQKIFSIHNMIIMTLMIVSFMPFCVSIIAERDFDLLMRIWPYFVLMFLMVVAFVIVYLRAVYGYYTYLLTPQNFVFDFQCLWFHRRKTLPLTDLQGVEQDYKGSQQERIFRTVSLVFPRKRFAIKVNSAEEQQFLAQKINAFVKKFQTGQTPQRTDSFAAVFPGSVAPPAGSLISTEHVFVPTLRIPIRTLDNVQLFACMIPAVFLCVVSVFFSSLFFMALTRGHGIAIVLGILASCFWLLLGCLIYSVLWRRFSVFFLEIERYSLKIYRTLGPFKSRSCELNFDAVSQVRCPDPTEMTPNAQNPFGAKYLVQIFEKISEQESNAKRKRKSKPILLPCRSLEEQRWLGDFLTSRIFVANKK